ncbi:MAG: hypothetical protein ACRD9L_00310 [Bryobacteraceae bacterium]
MKTIRWFLALMALLLAVFAIAPRTAANRPLWPGSPYTRLDRAEAVWRGLHFIYASAQNPANFASYGSDYLWCLRGVWRTSADPELRRAALRMGRERAREWRRLNPRVPPSATADDIYSLVSGSYAADLFGIPGSPAKEDLRRAAARFRPEEFLDFDPARESAPADIPEPCRRCESENARGARVCRKCGHLLHMKSRYEVMCDALVETYTGDRYGVRLGGSYPDVAQWMPGLRPYRGRNGGKNPDWEMSVYAVTHLVYTLNDYGLYHLEPAWLPAEFQFLQANFNETIAIRDAETLGEFIDTLKSFGLTDRNRLIRTGVEYLLSRQNADGSWGDPAATDVYDRYHSTWTAIDGLREYAWHGERVSFPEALRRLR